jgi:peptidoglycan-associated lipoprotein
MLRRRWTVCAMTALLFGGTAAAQAPGTLLLGGFGQYTKFDDALKLENHWGAGGRVGAFFAPNWNLEAENSWNRPTQQGAGQSGQIWYGPVSARIRYSFPVASVASIHIGAGGVISGYAGYEPDEPIGQDLIQIQQNKRGYNYGVEGDIGFSINLGTMAALRFDGIADYMPNGSPSIGGAVSSSGSCVPTCGPGYESHTNLRVQAGLELHPDLMSLFGGATSTAPWAPYMWWDEMPEHALPGTLEIGPFVQWTHFDDKAPGAPDAHVGFGGRVGVFLSDTHWELEGDGQNTKATRKSGAVGFRNTTSDDVSYTTFALRMLYNVPIASAAELIIGAGGVRSNYASESTVASIGRAFQYNYGISGDVGVRFRVANRVALRVDGLADYMKDTKNLNLIGRAGLSLLIGGGRREVMCTYAGLENIPASSPQCVAPAPPPPPPAAAMCPYPGLANLPAADPACVAPVVVTIDTTKITGPIYFDFDKSNIRPDAAATLDAKIPWLTANPGMRIRIEGNADERGSDEYNLALGQRRAASAKKYLVEHGIDAGRFDLVSYGEERPVCTDHTEDCWQRNRRDDFVIVTIGSDAIVVPPGGE